MLESTITLLATAITNPWMQSKIMREGSVDQWISGGRCSHGGAETRRKQREETTTRHKGNWRVPCVCLCVKHPWFPTGVLHCPGHPSCAGA
jgi:hypothetical protein